MTLNFEIHKDTFLLLPLVAVSLAQDGDGGGEHWLISVGLFCWSLHLHV